MGKRGDRGRRWMLDEKIEKSGMPPMTRHVLHTLLRRAVVKTGLIPDDKQPSHASLRAATGLGQGHLNTALNDAERRGWLWRKRGGGRGGQPTRYVVKLPSENVDPFLVDIEPRNVDPSNVDIDPAEPPAMSTPMSTLMSTPVSAPDQQKFAAQITGSDHGLRSVPSGPLVAGRPSLVEASSLAGASEARHDDEDLSTRRDVDGSGVPHAGEEPPYGRRLQRLGSAELIACWSSRPRLDLAPSDRTVHLVGPDAAKTLCAKAQAGMARPGAEVTCGACLEARDQLAANAGDRAAQVRINARRAGGKQRRKEGR